VIFTNVIKPTHLCNLACTYCYNDDVRRPVMADETLRRVIDQTFSYVRVHAPQRLVSFIWHGGEPMVAGLPYFEQAVKFQQEFGDGVLYDNSIQTNGTLINDRWLDFFKQERFSVSISIDGPRDLHDRFRVDRRGRGSFDRVEAAINRVQMADIPLGVCIVISRANVDHVEEIYDYVASRGLRFNVIPLNRSGGARTHFEDVGLEAEEYAPAWIRMYDRWFDADQDYVYCSDFVYKTRAILAGQPADCVALDQCSDTNIAVDPVGDVFGCATLSGSQGTKYGNLVEADLEAIMTSPVALDYRNRKTDPQCARCRWQHVCHGGCQARAYKFFGDHHRRDYYCPSLFAIYEHIGQRLVDKLGGQFIPASGPGEGEPSPVPAFQGQPATFPRSPAESPSACGGCGNAIGSPAPAPVQITLRRSENGAELL
jgi:uncharacterized protein